MAMKVVAIIGSRTKGPTGNGNRDTDIRCSELVKFTLNSLSRSTSIILSGGAASGADAWVKKLAPQMGFRYIEAPAMWTVGGVYNPRAGTERNSTIAYVCTHMVGIWDGKSTGTWNALTKAQALGRNIWILQL